MSWGQWAEQLLQDTKSGKTNTGGLLCDLDGNIWGAAGCLTDTMRFTEMAAMCRKVFPGGPAAQGSFNFPDTGTGPTQKYMVLRSDDSYIIGKKGQCGLTIAKYKNQGYLVGCYDETVQPGTSNLRVCDIAEQLNKM